MPGILYSLLAAIGAASKDLLSKKLAWNLSGARSAYASFLYAVPFYALALLGASLLGYESWSVGAQFVLYVLLRSLTDTAAEWLKMEALMHGDVSVVVCILATSPLFLLLLSPLLTGDPFTIVGGLAILLTVIGSLLLFGKRKSRALISKKAVALSLCAALFFAFNSCFDRLAVQQASPLLSGLGMTALSAFFLSFVAGGYRRATYTEFSQHRSALWGRGLLEVVFMTSKLAAMQYLQAPYVVAIKQLSTPLSVLGGGVLFKEKDLVRRLVAAALIVSGSGLVVLAASGVL